MIMLAAITASVWIWKHAIRTSGRLSPNSWKLLTFISVEVLILSVWGLEHSTHKLEPRNNVVRIWTDASASTRPSDAKFEARTMTNNIDLCGYCFSPFTVNTSTSLKAAFTVQAASPIIAAYSWDTNGNATSQPFSGTMTGTNFITGGTQVFFADTGNTEIGYSPIRWISRANLPIIGVVSTEPDNYQKHMIFWMSVFGMIVSPISTILTLILTWISLHRRKAEGILLRLEIEKQKLEIEKLRLEVERMRLEPPTPTQSLLILPG
jgi:hypothetical protein